MVDRNVPLGQGAAKLEAPASGEPKKSPRAQERQKRSNRRNRCFSAKNFLPEHVNTEISKHWDIDRDQIGQGGYGKVFVAQDRFKPDLQVAIKKVPVFHEEKRAAFKREVQIMKQLDHPNICKLLETYEDERFFFFVMELCEGGEVFERIMEHGLIVEATTADIVRQCASALLYAHQRGIAHRDMKPENVCFGTADIDSNFVKVIDWGLGFYFGEARMCSAVGSVTYAAPEVLEAQKETGYDKACDVWSLGVICFVMLCGKPPFWGAYSEQIKKMRKEQFPMSDKTWQGISSHAKDLIKAMLRANPGDRCSLDYVLAHPWLKEGAFQVDAKVGREVLKNLQSFSNTQEFVQVCVAGVARQLDQHRLMHVYQVFCSLDANGDGVLSLEEVKEGFQKMYGAGGEELKDIEELFVKLDLDGSGTIDYTEFCAAGMGERLSTEEDVLWAAFKAFDNDNSGTISREEIMKVLGNCDVDKVWSQEVCDEVTGELFDKFDQDKNGEFDFEEFVQMMRECAGRYGECDRAVTEAAATEATGGHAAVNFRDNYNALAQFRPAPKRQEEDDGRALIRSLSGKLGKVCCICSWV